MELKLIKNNGFTLGEKLKLLLGNTLLCRHCSGKLWWSKEIVDLGFNQKNYVIICFKCGKISYYDVEELEKHELNFVSLWAET